MSNRVGGGFKFFLDLQLVITDMLRITPTSLNFEAIKLQLRFDSHLNEIWGTEALMGKRSITFPRISWNLAQRPDIKEAIPEGWTEQELQTLHILRLTTLWPGPRNGRGTGVCFSWHFKKKYLNWTQVYHALEYSNAQLQLGCQPVDDDRKQHIGRNMFRRILKMWMHKFTFFRKPMWRREVWQSHEHKHETR